ncbi:MAG: Disaggregatase related [Deltaproteobacteria bacterium ADurb.Bin207]|jgi:predicted outer membrane repeat protein|nr:MAG: Disaggregatase related [Deltaproteobacteria bacterium ADurb.Bin207]
MKASLPFVSVAVLLLTYSSAQAGDLHVDARNSGSEDGTASHPYRSVQAAVSAAKDGDRIKIAGGTYSETISVTNKGIVFEGGYPGASSYDQGGSGDFNQADPGKHPTILQGSSGSAVLNVSGTVQTIVDGLVLRDGRFGITSDAYPELKGTVTVRRSLIENNGSASSQGGGIRAESALVVEDSVIRGNVGERGSGISARKASLRLVRSLVEDNESRGDHGGGVYAAGDVEVIGCVIRNNRVGEGLNYGWGGGIIVFNAGTNATIADTEVLGNYAPTKGSGIFVDDGARATIRNVLVANNQCSERGGAVYVDGLDAQHGSRATLINVTVAGHACGDGRGNALLLEQGSEVTVESSIFWGNGAKDVTVDPGNSLKVRYSNSIDNLSGDGNLSVDPLFANPGKGDYRLKNEAGRWDPQSESCVKDSETSPCVNAGDPSGAFDREPEPNGGRVDMGAYGNSLSAGCAANGGAGGFGGAGGTAGQGGTGGSGPAGGSAGGPGGSGGSAEEGGGAGSGGGGGGTGGTGQAGTGAQAGSGLGGMAATTSSRNDDDGCGCRFVHREANMSMVWLTVLGLLGWRARRKYSKIIN